MTKPSLSPIPQPWKPLWWRFEQHRRSPGGITLEGHHNRNYVVELREPFASIVGAREGEYAKFRRPLRTVRVVPRLWRNEAEVLRAVRPYVPHVPRCLTAFGRNALYSYADGVPLSRLGTAAEPVGEETMTRIAEIFGQLAAVPPTALPAHRERLPPDGDSTGFLCLLADFAERRVHQPGRRVFGGLFDALGIPRDAVTRFHTEAKALRPRPFGLLHTDLHRANLVVRPGGDLFVLDWETALLGDPLHDLATHLVRMDYGPDERRRMTALWQDQMCRAGLHDRLLGFEADLPVYLDFEYAQSVFPDTLRAALSLGPDARTPAFTRAADAVHRALVRARGPLGLTDVPSPEEAYDSLRAWHSARRGRRWGRRPDPSRSRT